ncbi:DeoR/GlpR family DNA-binding transcription regulator [Paenibacillus elgii]|uniref:DeoR/GlpR family DNA-binding transcription regulator n=1 Tax=Paenibacillus elgii TaxID=189691 RepID=UPI001EF7F92E|nr:hypothetical protein [Paenibacillus elgii]
MQPDRQITVVTNALNIAAELQNKRIPTIVIGGMMLDSTATLVGPVAAAALAKMAFNRVFIGTTGITVKHGYSNSNMHEAEIKQLAIAKATEVNVVADHTKFGRQDLFSFAPLHGIHRIVTDGSPGEELRAALEEASVDILLSS